MSACSYKIVLKKKLSWYRKC